jgi:hypothetical protein
MQKRETKTQQTHKRMDIETQTNEQTKNKHTQKTFNRKGNKKTKLNFSEPLTY